MKRDLPAYYSAGEGPAVVLLHCTLSSKSQWRTLTSLLETDHRVIAVDLYGYGSTPMPEHRQHFTLADEAKLLHSLLAEVLPDEPFHLVGHSYGGAVALCYCHHYDRARTLTLYEPVAFHLLEPEDPCLAQVLALTQDIAKHMQAGSVREAIELFLDYWSEPGTFAGYPARVQKDLVRRADKLLLDCEALIGTKLSCDDYRELQLPVTLITGRSSKLPALQVARIMSLALPHCRRFTVDAGHMGPVTAPELVNPIIKGAVSS